VPIIAMTARALADDRQRCLDAGMDDYLPKPLREAQLDAVLERWLGGEPEPPAAPAPGAEREPEPPAAPAPGAEREPGASVSAPAADGEPAVGLVDERRLLHFRDSYPDVIEPLLRLFSEATPPLIVELREAVAAGDDERLRRTAHKLKGGCQNVGALELGRLALELEDGGEPRALVDAIEVAFEPTRQELQRLLG
jgi:HPt (histidine-containing phosphotransfer) domain-containing protein